MAARTRPPALATALAVLALHTALAIWIFIEVHLARWEAQAGFTWFLSFTWFLMMGLDFPTTYIAWEYFAPTRLIRAVVEWGDSWGDGKNLRAFVLHGVLGGLQWFVIAWAAAQVIWPRTGVIARWRTKRNLTAGC
jgi:hypothetical protein